MVRALYGAVEWKTFLWMNFFFSSLCHNAFVTVWTTWGCSASGLGHQKKWLTIRFCVAVGRVVSVTKQSAAGRGLAKGWFKVFFCME